MSYFHLTIISNPREIITIITKIYSKNRWFFVVWKFFIIIVFYSYNELKLAAIFIYCNINSKGISDTRRYLLSFLQFCFSIFTLRLFGSDNVVLYINMKRVRGRSLLKVLDHIVVLSFEFLLKVGNNHGEGESNGCNLAISYIF